MPTPSLAQTQGLLLPLRKSLVGENGQFHLHNTHPLSAKTYSPTWLPDQAKHPRTRAGVCSSLGLGSLTHCVKITC